MLYVFENTDQVTEEAYNRTLPLLSEQRRRAVQRCRHLIDRVNGSLVYLMLRYALLREYDLDTAPVFGFRDNEKPFLAEHPMIHFSFSHCKNAAACLVSDSNTAVDIMDYRKRNLSTASRVCSEKELRQLEQSPGPDITFLTLWTRKECISKLNGIGLQQDFRYINEELPEWQEIRTVRTQRWLLSYCSTQELTIRYPSLESLLSLSEAEVFHEMI